MKLRLVLGVIGLLGLCALVAADQPPFPVIPTEFTTSVDVYVKSGTGTVLELQGYQNYSLSFQLSRYDFTWGPPDSPQYPLHTIAYESPGHSYYDTNHVCRRWPGSFSSLFAFVPESTYIGQQTINGRVSDGWHYVMKIPFVGTSYLTLWSQGNSPVQWNSTFVGKDITSITVLSYGPDFRPATFTPQQKQYFTAPKSCSGDGYLCPGPSKVTNMTMIRIHPSDNYNLTNKNTADISGDAFFICSILSSDAHSYDTLISVFEVQVNSSFGRYGKCNGGHCIGSNSFSVGRAATWGVKPFGGQCTNNSDTGTWYSMGGDAECPDGSPIGTNQCAWKTLARKKTIDLNCAASLGMLDACTEDPSIPVPLASDVLVKALQSCPDIPPSSSQALKPLKRNKSLDHDSFPLDPTDLFMRHQSFMNQILLLLLRSE